MSPWVRYTFGENKNVSSFPGANAVMQFETKLQEHAWRQPLQSKSYIRQQCPVGVAEPSHDMTRIHTA